MKKNPFFSIIIVCLNAESVIKKTIDSVLNQSLSDYEIIVKDGLSNDGTIGCIPKNKSITVVASKDSGIYSAMNQALSYANGLYTFFLNCGDCFASNDVLQKVYDFLKAQCSKCLLYGDYYDVSLAKVIRQNYKISDYFWYRTTICHQTVFLPTSFLIEQKFDEKYRIAADFKLLFQMYRIGCKFVYKDIVIAKYDGNGVSSTRKGKNINKREKKEIIKKEFTPCRRFFFFTKKCLSKLFKIKFY